MAGPIFQIIRSHARKDARELGLNLLRVFSSRMILWGLAGAIVSGIIYSSCNNNKASRIGQQPIQISEISNAITAYSLESKIDPFILLAIADNESKFNDYAISSIGAAGAFQLMPDVADSLGLKVYDLESFKQAVVLDDDRYIIRNPELLNQYIRNLKKNISGKSKKELARVDQRFVYHIAADAAARHIDENLNKGLSLEQAIAAYYAGPSLARQTPFRSDINTYVTNVKDSYEKFKKSYAN
nr:transglycosylase SLT domain-containing protein [Candidatus Woesearchaeota archaeon]